jgi:phosphate-selective porin OprO/OprP
VAAAALMVAGLPAVALADPGATREQQLEQRITELEAQLEQVMTAMQTNQTAQTTLESRIAELQTSMADDDGNDMKMYWSKGIRFDSKNKQFKFKFGGRIMNDWVWFDQDSDADDFYGSDEFGTGTEFRRARLYIAGTIYGNVGFKAQYDFAGGDADFKDVYISAKTPIGKAKVGHHHVPFGLEELTSSKYITFMERSLAAQLSPSRKTGISIEHGWLPEGLTLKTGFFRNSDGFGDDTPPNGAGEWLSSARLTGVVLTDEEQDMVLQLGGSVAQRKESEDENSVGLPGNIARVRARGAQHITTRFVDTGKFEVDDNTTMFGLDALFGMGPLHAQFEYAQQKYEVKSGSDADVDAMAVQVGYFLTGETRKYKASKANWDRTSPNSNYGDEEGDGLGAWEVAARYDTMDLNDGALRGGEIDQITLGLNWYLNPNTRVMFNYSIVEVDKLDDGGADLEPEIDIFQFRFQIDF